MTTPYTAVGRHIAETEGEMLSNEEAVRRLNALTERVAELEAELKRMKRYTTSRIAARNWLNR